MRNFMKNLVTAAVLLLMSSINAYATITVQMHGTIEGTKIEATHSFTKAEPVGFVKKGDWLVQFVADDEGDAAHIQAMVLMHHQGQFVVVSEPVLRAVWGKEAKISIVDDHEIALDLTFVATR